MNSKRFVEGLAALVMSISVTPPAQAAEVIEEIVVTAQKRSENLQDVPIAVSVVTGESLAGFDYANITDLQYMVPSVQFSESVHPRGEGFAIRGVGTTTFSEAAESSVGAVIDGVVVGQYGAAVFDSADLQQVEVLRGPQGMLFGKNATAGVLNILTHRPDLQGNSYRMRASGSVRDGDDYAHKLEGVANIVLDEGLGLRLVGVQTTQDGFVENVFDDAGQEAGDLNGREEYGIKGKLLWQPRDDLELYVTAGYAHRDADCCIWTTRTAPDGNNIAVAQAPVVAGPGNEEVNQNASVFHEMDLSSGTVEVNYDMGQHVLTSITGVRKWEIELNADSDQQPINVFDRNYGATTQEQFSQELRIASPQGRTVEYVAGVYYYWQDVDSFTSQVFSVPGVLRLGRDATPRFETTNVAAFANATVSVTEAFRIIAGGRYTYEKLDGDFTRVVTPGTDGVFTPDLTFEFETDAEEPSWRLGAQYDINDAMLYATVSRGFKGPSANILADFNESDPDAILVDPEFATSYEVGLKSLWLDGRLSANLAVFDTEFEDFQAQTYDQTRDPALFRITNAGELTTRGVELELVALLTDNLVVSTSASYVDSEFEDFRTSCYPFQTLEQGCEPVPGTPGAFDTDAAGNALNGSPEWSYVITASYERPLNDNLSWHVLGNYYWQDEVNYSAAGDPNTVQDDYGIFHLNAGIGSPDGRWRVSAFARNLFDEHFVNSLLATPLGFAAAPNTAASYSQSPTWEGRRILGLSLEVALD